jgi:hypothetical protein
MFIDIYHIRNKRRGGVYAIRTDVEPQNLATFVSPRDFKLLLRNRFTDAQLPADAIPRPSILSGSLSKLRSCSSAALRRIAQIKFARLIFDRFRIIVITTSNRLSFLTRTNLGGPRHGTAIMLPVVNLRPSRKFEVKALGSCG